MKRMNIFAVGDRVRVLDGSNIADYLYGWAAEGMGKLVGKAFTVSDITYYSDGRIAYSLENCRYNFDERGLEFADANQIVGEAVHIQTVGDRVVMAKDVKTGMTGYARCAPEDTFDFTVGAKLALDRLFELRNKKSKFKVGDRIIGNVSANKYGITREGWLGEVINVRDKDGKIDARSLETGETYYLLIDDRFDLCNYRVVPGDIVRVCEAIYAPAESTLKTEMATKLTRKPEYLARLDYISNFSTLKTYERTKAQLKVIAANEKFAMVAESDIGATYVIAIKGLTRC